ncbi:protein OPI10 homolog [Vespa velutina]|uniref:protein OPI10 homolog n=1 Tax=Vespa crabro TaxID=7445 RepID=UPI001F02FD29|nr:protein OPI10 homolog [Vespa crabro]XP_047352212.1 protein OPI10 homolog [Vespa velutina]XP_047352213.1 protein OPI10 homolog [Vespa velutina]
MMLGIIVSGRLVQTDFQQIGENQFLITVPDADNINHIVVFLTGTVPFPDGMGGAVYFSWPDSNAPPNWQFLGFISNVKPSAIFKISTLKKNHEFENSNLGIFGVSKISHVAQIGISVEPLNVIEQQAATVSEAATNSFVEFVQKMLTSFLNYVSSFSVTQAQIIPNSTENFVPLSTIQGWYETFERRLQQNPNFWKA